MEEISAIGLAVGLVLVAVSVYVGLRLDRSAVKK